MLQLRPRAELGGHNHGWLDTKHHFSFANYYDPERMGWGQLRVINDDTIQPHTGFSAHPHQDMEIITYVRKGAITHRDSLGNMGRTEAGDVQVMTAGTGIVHEEYNREPDITQLFQIWILPARKGLAPRWESRPFPKDGSTAGLIQLASGRKPQGQAMLLNADADLYGANLAPHSQVRYTTERGRYLYLLPATGHVRVDGTDVHAGDGLAIKDQVELCIEAQAPSEVLLIDVAG